VRPVRSGIAAGLLGAAALLSATLAVWAGAQLLRGEKTDAVFGALPDGCDWVLLADDPAGLAHVLGDASRLGQLPAAIRALAAGQRTLWLAATLVPDLDATQPWAICGQPAGAVLAAARRDGGVERFAWTAPGGDPVKLLARARVQGRQPSLAQNLPFRTALERVGGGQAHLFVDGRLLRDHRILPTIVRDGARHALWLGAALRWEGQEAKVHLHVGTGPSGATWLKAHLDPVGTLDAAPLFDAHATAGGVVRIHPGAWLARTEAFTPVDKLLRASLGIGLRELAPLASGHVVWQVLAPDRDAAPAWLVLIELSQPSQLRLPAENPDGTQLAWRRTGRFLVLAATADLAQRGADLSARTQALAATDPQLLRMMSDTQGFFLNAHTSLPIGPPPLGLLQGSLRCEALWLDTGFVAELSLPIPPTPH